MLNISASHDAMGPRSQVHLSFMKIFRKLILAVNLSAISRRDPLTAFIKRTIMTDQPTTGQYSAAYVTCPNVEVAKGLARGLVEKKIAACVNIIPGLTSVYEWEGKVEEDSEVLMMIKTRTSRVSDLTSYIKEAHPYDVPEVISVKIDQGNPAYLDWIGKNVPEK